MSDDCFEFKGRNLILVQCFGCGVEYAIPKMLYDKAKRRRGSQGEQIYCPSGHTWHYVGETEAQRECRRAERAEQRVAQRDDEIRNLQNKNRASKGQITKLKKRASGGVCPCCNRSFQNLRRHMDSKHPDFAAEAA